MGFSILNHPEWGSPILGNPLIVIVVLLYTALPILSKELPLHLPGFTAQRCHVDSTRGHEEEQLGIVREGRVLQPLRLGSENH